MSRYATYEYLKKIWEGTFNTPYMFSEVMARYDGEHDRPRRYHAYPVHAHP